MQRPVIFTSFIMCGANNTEDLQLTLRKTEITSGKGKVYKKLVEGLSGEGMIKPQDL